MDPTYRFTTSWLISPEWLLLQRSVYTLYAFVTLIAKYIYNGVNDNNADSGNSFSYFTELTWWGLAFYGLFASIHTFNYCRTGKSSLNSWHRILQEAHRIYYSTITVYPLLVTVVFWILLFGSTKLTVYTTWTNVTQHGLNSLYAITEIILPRTEPHPWIHLIPIIIIVLMYLAVAFITFHTKGFYVYGFLDDRINSKGAVAGYCFGILAAIVILFIIVKYGIWLRVFITEKKKMMGVFSEKDEANQGKENEGNIEMQKEPTDSA